MGVGLKALLDEMRDDDVLGLPVRTVKRMYEHDLREGPREILSTEEAAETLGYAESVWSRWAASGEIWADVGGRRVEAWKDAGGKAGKWRLPREACLAHLARLQARGTKGKPRGPRPKGPKGPRLVDEASRR